MQSSRSTKKTVNASRRGNPSPAENGMMSEGEGMPVAATQTTILNERPNKSVTRNNGNDRPSANPGMIPTVDQGVRKTGRI